MMFKRSATVAAIVAALTAVLAPRTPTTPVAWAEKHMIAPDGPRKGHPLDFELTPYLIEPLNFFANAAPGNKAVFQKSKQIGATTLAIAACGYTACEEPEDVFLIEPTSESLTEFIGEKFQRAREWSPAMAEAIFDQVARSGKGSTAYIKRFTGGSILMANASSAPGLRGKTRKKVIRDEAAGYPDDLEGEGSPHDMITGAYESFLASGEWKDLWISTPVLKGDAFDLAFEGGDQRYWHVVCPHCRSLFWFTDDPKHFHFNKTYPYKPWYSCPHCGSEIQAHEKNALVQRAHLAGGGWIATKPGPGKYISWHFDAMSSPFVPWDVIAERLLGINGDATKQKGYDTLTMGRGYEVKGDAPDHVRLMALREKYDRARIPPLGLLLTLAADIQANAIYFEVLAFAPDRATWVVEAGVLDGDTSDHRLGSWAKLTEVYEKAWPDSFGGARRVDAVAVDSGFRAHIVYAWCRERANAFAVKGGDGWSRPAIGTPSLVDLDLYGKKIKNGATLWTVGTWSLKNQFYSDLRKPRLVEGAEVEPPGCCHFHDSLTEEYFKQLTNEYLQTVPFRGRTRCEWKEAGPNHWLDCRVYNLAIADYLGLSRMTADEWKELAKLRGAPDHLINPDLLAPASVRIAAPAPAAPALSARPTAQASPPASAAPGRSRSRQSSFM